MSEYLTLPMAAQVLQRDRTTVWDWVQEGRLKAIRVRGNKRDTYLVRLEEVERVKREMGMPKAEELHG